MRASEAECYINFRNKCEWHQKPLMSGVSAHEIYEAKLALI